MQIIESAQIMQRLALGLAQQGKPVVLVPTMGALHEGHLALVDKAKAVGDRVVLSVFVNPSQFGAGEDFEQYPRPLAQDQAKAKQRGVDYFFCPSAEAIYPPGDQTSVLVTKITRGLCGAFRPGHFRGVVTVVAKLFLICQPKAAVFGEKDYQQLQVIRRMVQDLHFPVEIIGLPTVREPDGLALSSRNQYLSKEERKLAKKIPQALFAAQAAVQEGVRQVSDLKNLVLEQVQEANIQVDYVEILESSQLEPVELLKIGLSYRLLLAVHLGQTRLIDNIALGF